MAINYDLTQKGQEVQEALDNVEVLRNQIEHLTTDDVHDTTEGKSQAGVNTDLKLMINSETSRAQSAEANLLQIYRSLTQSDIVPVDARPETGEVNKIYRVSGESSYADWMWDSEWHKLAEYDNGIDDEPTAGSDNLVKSGGVYAELYGRSETTYVTIQNLVADKYYNTNRGDDKISSPSNKEGVYCVEIPVTAGEKYRITGKGGTAAIRLYATTDSGKNILNKSETSVNYRSNPLELIIEDNESFLYVNLSDYSSSTDKVEKVITTQEGGCITEIVEDISNIQENVSSMEEDIEDVEDEITEIKGTDNTNYVELSLEADSYFNMQLDPLKTSSSPLDDTYCKRIAVTPGEKYRITGKGNSAAVKLYATTDALRNVIRRPDVALNTRNNPLEITIDNGEAYLYVNLYEYSSTTDKFEKVITTHVGGYKEYVDSEVLPIKNPLIGKTIVSFGDSITEKIYDGKHYSNYISEITGATVINVGIGGARIQQRTTPVENPETESQAYAALDIVNMVKASVEQDFTKQINASEYLRDHASDDNTAIVTRLTRIDWSNVWMVTILGGTNDWNNAGNRLGTTGSSDINTTLGAVNEIIRMLLSEYPHLQIQWISPIVRWLNYTNGEGAQENWSDVKENAGGITLKTFSSILGTEVQNNHIDYKDLYNTLGWNMYNFSQYFGPNDGTHPTIGLKYIGKKIGHYILSNSSY